MVRPQGCRSIKKNDSVAVVTIFSGCLFESLEIPSVLDKVLVVTKTES